MTANNWALQDIEEGENEPRGVERRCQSNAAVLASGSVQERKAQRPEEERQEAFESLRTFEREDYRAGFWVRHRHVNTIAGSILAVAPPDPAYRRVRWDTPDGKLQTQQHKYRYRGAPNPHAWTLPQGTFSTWICWTRRQASAAAS